MRTYSRLRSTSLLAAACGAALVAACTGTIGGDGDGSGGDGNGNGNGVPSGHLDPATACNGVPSPGAAPLRRLTQSQYNNTVRDLLGDTTHPADTFPPDETVGTFSNNAASLTVSPLLAQAYFTASEALAQNALKNNRAALLKCDPKVAGEDACAKQFIDAFGKRAYRRPLTAAEQADLLAVYNDNKTDGTFDDGVEAVIETVLNSASFLYLEEYGVVAQNQNGVLPVGPYEMASRLSYFLWNSTPDDALLDAAAKNELGTLEQVKAQARRMLADPKAHDASREFYDQWLMLKKLAGATKDPTTYADFSEAARKSMLGETRAFVDWVMWQSDAKLQTLLTAPVTFLDQTAASFYGLSVTGATFQQTQLDPSQRAGILTQPSILTTQAKPNQSSPILRGKFVRERFFCQQLPPPPPGLVIVPPEVKPGSTTRDRFAQHDNDPNCAGCHKLMDPIGFGFEHYDGVGRWRAQDQGLAIDATGTLSATDVDGNFNGATDLASKMATSQEVKDCVAINWYRYTMARAETDVDKCSLAITEKAFGDADYDMRELLVAITTTDAFRYRPEVKP